MQSCSSISSRASAEQCLGGNSPEVMWRDSFQNVMCLLGEGEKKKDSEEISY